MVSCTFNYRLLLLLLVAVSTSAGATNNKLGGWPFWSPEAKTPWPINLYELFYEYVKAVAGQGIPALNVPPLDPLYLPVDGVFTDRDNPDYPNYTSIVVNTKGLIVYDFSDFNIDIADLDLYLLYANLQLSKPMLSFFIKELHTSVIDIDGNVHSVNCTDMELGVSDSTYLSVKELEVDGSRLQVKRFQIKYDFTGIAGTITLEKCSGDLDISGLMLETVFTPVADWLFNKLPTELDALNARITTVLNDIFGLRNITDIDVTRVFGSPARSTASELNKHEYAIKPKPKPKPLAHDGRSSVSRFVTRAAHSQAKQDISTSNNNKMQIKWSNWFY